MYKKVSFPVLILSYSCSYSIMCSGLSLVAETYLQLWSAPPEGESLRVGRSLYFDRDMLWSCKCFHPSLCHLALHFHPSLSICHTPSLCLISFILLFFLLSVSLVPPSCLFLSQICCNLSPPKLPRCYEFPAPPRLQYIGRGSSPNFWQFISIHVWQNRTFMSL